MGHLGPRVSALLDGRLSPEETERAWAHVHVCHVCRDLVEREGWVKTRLAGLSHSAGAAPVHLKGSLLGGEHLVAPRESHLAPSGGARSRRTAGVVALGGGAVGVAVLGVLALGVAPADGPVDRRAPVTNLARPSDTPRLVTPTLFPSPATSPVPSVRGQRTP